MKRALLHTLEYPGDGLYYLDGTPFEGVAITLAKDGTGQEKSCSEFRAGLRWGVTREQYPEGTPMIEANYFKGVLHGRAREWHRNGQLAEDGEYEFGFTLWSRVWNSEGVLEKDYQLQPSEKAWRELETARVLYGTAR